jgi:hypothetical protein
LSAFPRLHLIARDRLRFLNRLHDFTAAHLG